MKKKHEVMRAGFVAAGLAAMLSLTAPVFAQEDVHEGIEREVVLDEKYILLPVENEAPDKILSLVVDGKKVRELVINLARDKTDWWAFIETKEFAGKRATLRAERLTAEQLDSFFAIRVDSTYPGEDEVYQEKLRPQLHFSSKRGWNNDPNGMMYYGGEYHLFYQHNPYGWDWGNMTWGHAVSTDLVHWEEIGDALQLDEYGTMFSGSGVVDWNNTTGFQTGDEPPLITIYTNAGDASPWSEGKPFTQGVAYSNDRGRTWTKHDQPVQGHINEGNRDPKVIWWEETKEWVIVLFLSDNRMAFFRSPDLKRWELQSVLKSFHECPELFQLAVDGDEDNKKWILYGGAGDYFIGDFDGSHYKPEGGEIKFNYGDCFYASQTFSDIPKEDGRRIQMTWGTNDSPGMPFNQMIGFPVVLTLHTTDEGLRMFANPVKEIEKLYANEHEWTDVPIPADQSVPAPGIEGELFDIEAVLDIGDAEEIGLSIRGEEIIYNVEDEELVFGESRAPLKAKDGSIRLRCIVDRTSIEIFANGGQIYMPCKLRADDANRSIAAFARGGAATATSIELRELNSIWK
ncbi:GH32 C-terminal domain-containing protein [Bythopirellula goksoeyrii]|uniref:Levanase n=1 Tax=Bythopirellula goksoeyrii TaxID=1400387 RepID=A0A5B9QI63_9BACT|nr:GH32 C-terminal domain-containing protein [Bythopirellula goksoeyrii]QEG37372.1 Levanase precursor [Bythopirellula goksoeyrii]